MRRSALSLAVAAVVALPAVAAGEKGGCPADLRAPEGGHPGGH